MGLLDAQLAQGYSINYSMKLGLLDHEQSDAINDIQNGLQLVDNFLSLGMHSNPGRFKRVRRAEVGEYRSTAGEEFGNRISSGFRMSATRTFTLRFSSVRLGRSPRERKNSERRARWSREVKSGGKTVRRVRRAEKAAVRARRLLRLRRVARVIRFVI